MNDKEILKNFLDYPLGTGEDILDRFASLKGAVRRVNEKNRLEQFVFIPGLRDNRVIMIAHADTYWDQKYYDGPANYFDKNSKQGTIMEHQMVQTGNIVSSSNPGFGIGADDRAGCAILWLLRNFGHSLLITNGEEHGGQGSNWLMDYHGDIADEINNHHQFAIQFDRRNSRDFKCYTVGTNEFCAYIEKETGYTEPDPFKYTDIVTLCRRITGVNLSIGYYNEHTEKEYLNISEWEQTLNIARKWLEKTDLPEFLRNV
jgi:hypothetical protein